MTEGRLFACCETNVTKLHPHRAEHLSVSCLRGQRVRIERKPQSELMSQCNHIYRHKNEIRHLLPCLCLLLIIYLSPFLRQKFSFKTEIHSPNLSMSGSCRAQFYAVLSKVLHMSSVQQLMSMKEFVFSMLQSDILMHFWYWPTKTIFKTKTKTEKTRF